MNISSIKSKIPEAVYFALSSRFTELRPSQEKAINAGLLEGKNLLVCTPTASGKTVIAEMAFMKAILEKEAKAVYIVPLKALATEKHKEFKEKYGKTIKIALSIGDFDSAEPRLEHYDLIICTAEKLDSLIRHYVPWLSKVKCVIVDEVHLLNDPGRGPTLEILITILRQLLKEMQLIALSATIGNPEELAEWLGAELVIDDWRPVRLDKGIYYDGEVEFD
ncbi:DEAD/DEAH box helicase [Candidatus Woesearchaeota archaeon]|nr:DEAD/DEAH box helicase [Candidatus Woesearchaeota archaeon]